MLASTANKGFQLTFENGLTISVQFGSGNYCSNRNLSERIADSEMKRHVTTSHTAEVAIWDNKGKDFKFKNGELAIGWLSADEVADWIEKVKNAKTLNDIEQ